MKKYLMTLLMLLMLCNANVSWGGEEVAIAVDDSFQQKLQTIEQRADMLRLVLKKLSRTYKKAKKDQEFLLESGMPEAEVKRLERAFQKKINRMINQAVAEITII